MLKNRIARKKFLLERYKNITCSCCTLKVMHCEACGQGFKEGDPIICLEDELHEHFIRHYCFNCIDLAVAVKQERGATCKKSSLQEEDIGSSDITEKKNQDSKRGIDTEDVEGK